MKGWVLYGPGDMKLEDLPRPTPGPGEVLIQVGSVGVCASDIHWYVDGRIGDQVVEKPTILGHEFAGTITEVGSGVTRVKPGDRAAVEPSIGCLECDMCLEGNFNVCRSIQFAGTTPIDGAFREYVAWPARCVEKISDDTTLDEAAMCEPLGVGLYSVDLAGDLHGKRVAVLGAGAIGLSALQCAILAGASEVFVSDLIPGRLELARKLGAARTFDARQPDIAEQMLGAADGCGFDVVFEAAGENEAVRQATRMARPLGMVVVIGIPYEDDMVVSAATVRRNGLTLRMVRRSNQTVERCVHLVGDGKLDTASYVTHRFPLERLPEALELANARTDGVIRAIVRVSEERKHQPG